MEVKPLRERDVPKLQMLLDDLIGGSSDIQDIYRLLSEIADKPYYKLFCLYEGNLLVGTASLTKCFDLTGDCSYYYAMENFVIDRAYRHKGYGTFLLRAVEEYAVQSGGRYIGFLSSAIRKNAHAFYEKNGYDPNYTKGYKKVFKK